MIKKIWIYQKWQLSKFISRFCTLVVRCGCGHSPAHYEIHVGSQKSLPFDSRELGIKLVESGAEAGMYHPDIAALLKWRIRRLKLSATMTDKDRQMVAKHAITQPEAIHHPRFRDVWS